MPNATEAESSASGANKRPRSPSLGRSPSQSRSPPPKRRKVGKVNKKKRPLAGRQSLRMRKDPVPKEAQTLLAAFYVHLRILWGLFSSVAVPQPPDDAILDTFEQRYTSFDDALQTIHNPNAQMSTNEDLFDRIGELRSEPGSTSKTAQQAARISESSIHHILVALTMYGLRAWRPSFLDDPYSTYNSTHRFIALETFRQLAVSSQYDHMAINKKFLGNTHLLTRAYDHFVHYRMKCKWEKEVKYPGVAELEASRDVVLARKRNLANARSRWAKDAGYSKYVQKLVGSYDGTSDDEEGTAKLTDGETVQVYFIKEKKERAPTTTALVRYIDQQRKQASATRGGNRNTPVAAAKRKAGVRERIRVLPKTPRYSDEPLPEDVPMDWYAVARFNELDISFRVRFAPTDKKTPTIAMPDDIKLVTQQRPLPDWRNLSHADFMEKQGNARLALYDIPTSPVDESSSDSDSDSDSSDDERFIIAQDASLAEKQKAFAKAAEKTLGPTEPKEGGSTRRKDARPRKPDEDASRGASGSSRKGKERAVANQPKPGASTAGKQQTAPRLPKPSTSTSRQEPVASAAGQQAGGLPPRMDTEERVLDAEDDAASMRDTDMLDEALIPTVEAAVPVPRFEAAPVTIPSANANAGDDETMEEL